MSWASLNEFFWHELYTSFLGTVQAASITTYFNGVCFQRLLNRMGNLNLGPMYSRYLVCISKFIFLENFFWGQAIVNHILTSILWLQHLPHYFSLLVSHLSIYDTQWNAWCYWNFWQINSQHYMWMFPRAFCSYSCVLSWILGTQSF